MIIPIFENLFLLHGTKPTRFPYCNCILIEDQVRTVIDTGLEFPVLQEAQPEKVELVLNSHGHTDHTQGNQAFTQAQIAIHALDAPFLRSMDCYAENLMGQYTEFVEAPLNYQVHFDCPGVELAVENSQIIRFPGSRVDLELREGEIIDLGKVQLQVLHTPGHTQGHCCFYWAQENILFSADIDLTRSGPWYGDKGADIDQFMASIQRIRELKPRMLVPGHGKMITENIELRFEQYLAYFYRLEEKLLLILQKPCTLEELSALRLIYPDHTYPLFLYWEKVMLLKHLTSLIKQNRLQQKDEFYFV